MRFTTLSLAAAIVLIPAGLSAQDETSGESGRTTASARIETALATAMETGIPVTLLQGKVDEGKAKGVDMTRIAAAVEARLAALTRAQDAMANAGVVGTTEGELSVAADALQAGVSEAALATVSTTAPQERRAVAIAVLSELVAAGHVPEQALAQVQAALARGPEALANLRAGVGAGAAAEAAGAAGAAGAGVNAGADVPLNPGGNRNPRN